MKLFIEGVKYPKEQLLSVFDDSKFYYSDGKFGIINSVGYYHSFEKNELVYLLPKVFLVDGLVFGVYSPLDLLHLNNINSIKHKPELLWVRQLIVFFYKSLAEFKKRNKFSELIENFETLELNSNIGEREYSYLDLLLSFVNFHKKNKTQILYKHVAYSSTQTKKVKWEKTIRKSIPIFINEAPIYTSVCNISKERNQEEELIIYFYSILNYFNTEFSLGLSIDRSINLIKGTKFISLSKSGLSKLRKIKYRYFSDTLIKMYRLVYLFFEQTDLTSSNKKREEFIAVKNYNIIFEDMIDKLFSDSLNETARTDEFSLIDLKNNKDGKIIDHIYEDMSLLDNSNIFYIGDSKYYKPGNFAGNISVFKQFTYSKNIIQFNIDLLNQTKNCYNERIKYRDEITEGYNITPNFFIYGFIPNYRDFENSYIEKFNETKKSYHFQDRLFDRDSLFIQQYRINFLYVLKNYSLNNSLEINSFRTSVRFLFRQHFLDYFNSPASCGYMFYCKTIDEERLKEIIELNFKRLNGKCFYSKENKLIIGVKNDDSSLNDLITDFKKYQLT